MTKIRVNQIVYIAFFLCALALIIFINLYINSSESNVKAEVEKAKLIQERITFFSEAPEMMGYFYEDPKVGVELLASEKQKVKKEDLPKILELITKALSSIEEKDWSHESIMNALEPMIAPSGFKKGQILWPLRALLTGREYSPGAYEVAAILGKEKVMKRIQSCT